MTSTVRRVCCLAEPPRPLEVAAGVFSSGNPAAPPVDLAPLHAKVGQLALENDLLECAFNKAGLLSARP